MTKGTDRFTIAVDGTEAGFVQFTEHDGRRVFFHTEVDDAFSGQGLASVLVRRALARTSEDGLRVVPVCPYVKRWLEKHPDHADLAERPTRADLDAVRAAGG